MNENPNGTGRGRQVGDPFVPEEPTQAVRDFFGPAFSDVAEYARMLEEKENAEKKDLRRKKLLGKDGKGKKKND